MAQAIKLQLALVQRIESVRLVVTVLLVRKFQEDVLVQPIEPVLIVQTQHVVPANTTRLVMVQQPLTHPVQIVQLLPHVHTV